MKTIVKKAALWEPKNESDLEHDKKVFIKYLVEHCQGRQNAKTIDTILQIIRPKLNRKDYKRGSFQQSLVVPFKEEKEFYVGTDATKGIYLVVDAEDVVCTLNFYRSRIRAEHKHLRNLKSIAKKHNLLRNISIKNDHKVKRTVFFDESGTPSLNIQDKYFIVGAVVVNNDDIRKLQGLFAAINSKLGLPPEAEIKSTRLDAKKYKYILNKIAKIDYEFAAICFVKKYLTNKGYQYPKSFYKQSFKFLVGDILDYIGEASLCFDEYGAVGSKFEKEFFKYIKNENFGFVLNNIFKMTSDVSSRNKSLQLSDLLIGAIKYKLKKKFDVTPWFEEKIISVQYFPHL